MAGGYKPVLVILATLSIMVGLFVPATAKAETPQALTNCKAHTIIYVRGSGEAPGSEHQPLQQSLRDKLATYGVKNSSFIELTPDLGTKHAYTATDRTGGADGFIQRQDQAPLRVSYNNQYQKSAEAGVLQLLEYLESSNYRACQTKLVLAGYEQGAHVIGSALHNDRMKPFLGQVAAITLFADPTLDRGLPGSTAPWLRGDVIKGDKRGWLPTRSPYLPPELIAKTGSWCADGDARCSGLFWQMKCNTNCYVDPKHSYGDEAAEEIAYALGLGPTASVKGLGAYGVMGQDLTLHVAGRNPVSTQYEWDVNCDDETDHVTVGAALSFIPNQARDCVAKVWTGHQELPFRIHIAAADTTNPGPVENLRKMRTPDGLRLEWNPPTNADRVNELAYAIFDGPNRLLGFVWETSVVLADIGDNDKVFIVPISAGGLGEWRNSVDHIMGNTSNDHADGRGQGKPFLMPMLELAAMPAGDMPSRALVQSIGADPARLDIAPKQKRSFGFGLKPTNFGMVPTMHVDGGNLPAPVKAGMLAMSPVFVGAGLLLRRRFEHLFTQ